MNDHNRALFNDFIAAQNRIYPQVINELKAGKKRSHWMWFIFPQIQGLGHSAMAQRFALQDVAQAKAYLHHKVLGARLIECATLLLQHSSRSAFEIFGTPDDLKLRSSLTLFAQAVDGETDIDAPIFDTLLQQFFDGQEDERTQAIIGRPLSD